MLSSQRHACPSSHGQPGAYNGRMRARSRHWFFGARLVLDGQAAPETLMQMVKATLRANPNNSVIGFKDNSSAIRRATLAAACLSRPLGRQRTPP